ncbi:MAG: pilus assembly protein [Anaerolineales bacterium]
MSALRTQFSQEQGQGMVEYVLIILLVALFLLATWSFFGNGILNGLIFNIVAAI